jgi:hypothetical protein
VSGTSKLFSLSRERAGVRGREALFFLLRFLL